jgi:hypothetical protein
VFHFNLPEFNSMLIMSIAAATIAATTITTADIAVTTPETQAIAVVTITTPEIPGTPKAPEVPVPITMIANGPSVAAACCL